MYFINSPFNYLPSTTPSSVLVQLDAGEVGWLSISDPDTIEFGPVGISLDIVSGNPAWFKQSTDIPFILTNEPIQGSTVYIINQSAVTSRPYMPTGQSTGQNTRDRDDWTTQSLHKTIQNAQKELMYRYSEKLLIELAIKYNNGWIPDWNNKTQAKWFIVSKYGVIQAHSTTEYDMGAIYFINQDACQRAIVYMDNLVYNLFNI